MQFSCLLEESGFRMYDAALWFVVCGFEMKGVQGFGLSGVYARSTYGGSHVLENLHPAESRL